MSGRGRTTIRLHHTEAWKDKEAENASISRTGEQAPLSPGTEEKRAGHNYYTLAGLDLSPEAARRMSFADACAMAPFLRLRTDSGDRCMVSAGENDTILLFFGKKGGMQEVVVKNEAGTLFLGSCLPEPEKVWARLGFVLEKKIGAASIWNAPDASIIARRDGVGKLVELRYLVHGAFGAGGLPPAKIAVTALFDVGWGRSLYIRGEGPGLSWTKGQIMHNTAPDRWEWTSESMADSIQFKLLIDDREWSLGSDFTAHAHMENVVEPDFGGPIACDGRIVPDNWRIPGCGLTLVRMKPGTFTMGGNGARNETRHKVTLTDTFWIGKCPVTQGQWRALMGNNPSRFHFVGDEAPVDSVLWFEALEFCLRLTERERAAGRLPEGYAYSLPTEAQWEYACMAGHSDMSGEPSAMEMSGWFRDNSGGRTHPIGGKHANAWGLHDMLGNLCEWCWDWYGVLEDADAIDPTGPSVRQIRRVPMEVADRMEDDVYPFVPGIELQLGKVCRGGSWQCSQGICGSSSRCDMDPKCRFATVGFRVALRRVRN